jgi:hypothetical protein
VRLLFVSEPSGQRDPGNADFGSDLAAVVSGFPQVTPQGINDVLGVHGIFIPASLFGKQSVLLNQSDKANPYATAVYL